MRLSQIWKSWQVSGSTLLAELYGGLILNGPLTGVTNLSLGTRIVEPLVTLTYAASIALDASLGNLFVVTVTDAVPFEFAAPSNQPAAPNSQVIVITIRNGSGGAHGAGTFNAVFKTSAAVPAIADTKNRSFCFRSNGTNWVELWRTAADVAN
jgi:hypothetical protein